MNDIVGRLQSAFPSHQLDVIIGSLLGDARLECRSKGIRALHTARFRVHHGEKQKDYVWWKYQLLKDLVLRQPQEIKWRNEKRNLNEVSWFFHTKTLKSFGLVHEIFYKNGKKVFPKEILPILNDAMLAVWFMDDGSNNGKSLILNTRSFSIEDQKVIIDFLREKYSIDPRLVKDRQQWKIAIRSRDYKKFIDTITCYVPKSMIYKIANPRNDLPANVGRARGNTFANTSVPNQENLEKV